MQKIKRIVIPVDESDVSKVAVEQGTYFAKSLNADVSIISVNDTNQYMVSKILEEKVIKEKKSKLEEIKRIAQEKGLTATTTFVLGEPAEEITKFVKETMGEFSRIAKGRIFPVNSLFVGKIR